MTDLDDRFEAYVFAPKRERIVQKWRVIQYQFVTLFSGNGITTLYIWGRRPRDICFTGRLHCPALKQKNRYVILRSRACKLRIVLKAKIILSLFVFVAIFGMHTSYAVSAVAENKKQSHISPDEAATIGLAAYIYGYPIVTMEINCRMMTNVVAPDEAKAPMGQFAHIRKYPKASFKHHKAPDTDVLSSTAWVDLEVEPYILHVPKVGSRCYLLPLVSGWSEIFASITPRMNGGNACDYALTGPGWKGTLPPSVKEIKSPTNTVWITGRTYCCDSAEDYKAVHVLQNLYSLMPLSSYTQHAIYAPPKGVVDASVNMNSPVHEQIQAMDVETYFNLLTHLMQKNPAGPEDQSMLKDMAKIGLIPGTSFSLAGLDHTTSLALQNVPKAALAKIVARAADRSKLINGWVLVPHTSDTEDYLQRASQAYKGIRVALPEDALFAFATHDLNGQPLIGTNLYIIHFAKEQTPPVHSFWSLAAYNDNYQLTPNALNRYNIHSEDMLKYNLDGSLDIYVQHVSPGPNKASNWLPIPQGAFVLMFRLYRPKDEILKGTWLPPSVIIDPF